MWHARSGAAAAPQTTKVQMCFVSIHAESRWSSTVIEEVIAVEVD
jgi:hypothetical protein